MAAGGTSNKNGSQSRMAVQYSARSKYNRAMKTYDTAFANRQKAVYSNADLGTVYSAHRRVQRAGVLATGRAKQMGARSEAEIYDELARARRRKAR